MARRSLGKLLPAFIHHGAYHLTNIVVYADGMVDCWGLVDWAGFLQKVESGWVVTTLPEGAEVSLSLLTHFKATKILFAVPEPEFVKEALDAIEELNGRPNSSTQFIEAKKLYWAHPSDENRAAMHAAFERVPHHRKKFTLNERDKRYFREQGIKAYETVWELNDGGPRTSA
jgi:hypothetical protein